MKGDIPKKRGYECPEGEFNFNIWKAELNKDLMNFWDEMDE